LLWIWIALACIFSYLYERNLLKFLVVQDTEKPIDTFGVHKTFVVSTEVLKPHSKDVLASNLPFAIPANTVIDQLMETSPRRIIRQVYNKALIKYPTVKRPPWILDMMNKGQTAFVVSDGM